MTNIFDRIAAQGNGTPEVLVSMESKLDAIESHLSDTGKADISDDDGGPPTSREVKEVVQELLKHGYLEEASRQGLLRRAVVHERAIAAVLEPLDLMLRIDSHRGVAFLAIARHVAGDATDEDEWSHPLVRRQRLTLEQSLLIALLRQRFMMHEQECGVGQSSAKIAVDDLLPQFQVYFADSGSDAKNESRVLGLLDQLKTYGIVSEVDKQNEVIIRPLIAHLAHPESLMALLRLLQEQSHNVDPQRADSRC
jgi:hypothetical protein